MTTKPTTASAGSEPGTNQSIMPASGSNLANKLYLTTWRWHFYSGLFVVPFMLMLALTGLVILFQPQIEELQYRDRLFVAPQTQTMPVDTQLEAVRKAYPNAEIGAVIPPSAPDRSTQVNVTIKDGPNLTVFVNPYSNAMLGQVQNDQRWGDVATTIHGSFLLGDFGDRVIEIAAGLGILLFVTGLYMWWPRNKNGLYGTLIPRFNMGKRIMWRDLHAVPGVWLGVALVMFLVTGMAWTGIWGEKFVQAWNTFPAALWNDVPQSDKTHASMNTSATKTVPWNLEQTPLPASGSMAGKPGIPAGTPVTFDTVIAYARDNGFGSSLRVNAPGDEKGVWTVSQSSMDRQVNDARNDLTIHIDQYTGKVLASVGWNDYSLAAKAMAAGVGLHMGGLGLWNIVLNAVFCLGVILISVSGVVMWWLRRPAGVARVVAPPAPKNMPLWKGAVVVLVVLGVAFPLAGAAMLGAVLLDFLVLSRIKPLRAFFA
jgi:uncharacterized iron-regulated membrane protein